MSWFETNQKESHSNGAGSNTEWCCFEGAAISEGCTQRGKTNCRGWQRTAIPLLAAQVSMSDRSFIFYRAHDLLIQHSFYWQGLMAGSGVTSDGDSAAEIHSRQKFANHFLKQCSKADIRTHTTCLYNCRLHNGWSRSAQRRMSKTQWCAVSRDTAWLRDGLGTESGQNCLEVQGNCKWCVDWSVHCW
jgi:hypothetical protein